MCWENIVRFPVTFRVRKFVVIYHNFGGLLSISDTVPTCVSECLGSGSAHDSTVLDLKTYSSEFLHVSVTQSVVGDYVTRPDVTTVVSRVCRHGPAPTADRGF